MTYNFIIGRRSFFKCSVILTLLGFFFKCLGHKIPSPNDYVLKVKLNSYTF